MPSRGEYIHDLRHRYSLELRPDEAFDGALRGLARDLEEAGLVRAGESTKPRFHPHLTLGRAAVTSADLTHGIAETAASIGAEVELGTAATFGYGRIIYLELTPPVLALTARAAMVAHLENGQLDPLMTEREWIPHVTIAYNVPEETRAEALAFVRAALPIRGAFDSVQAWDLDVRPTVLVHRAGI